MQTILGSGGIIAIELARTLTQYTDKIRLVSRNPKMVNSTDELLAANLLNSEEVDRAIMGSEVAYITIGFPYKISVWRESWPNFTKNVIESCKKHNCKLVFFDNIYMYDRDYLDGMTEETPIRPTSKKGEIRAEIANMILSEIKNGSLTALIARCADYYGPEITHNSVLAETVFKPFSEGKKASWLGSLNFKHSYTYTPDAGKATALLGNTPNAYGEVWHLPTAPDPMTGGEWIEAIAREMNVKPKSQVAGKFLLKLLSLFNSDLKELPEMMYQYDRDYVFNSDKFENKFNIKPTAYMEGIKAVIESDYN